MLEWECVKASQESVCASVKERAREYVCLWVCVCVRVSVFFVPSEVSDEMSSITWGIETLVAKNFRLVLCKKIQSLF